MHLVDDIDTVSAHLRRYPHLIHQSLDVIHTVVGCGIKLMDTVGPAFRKREARLTCTARLHLVGRIGTVDHLCEYARSGGLSHSTRTAEQVGMSQLPPENGILESLGYVVLSDECAEGVRPVFSCRYYILAHIDLVFQTKSLFDSPSTYKDRYLFCNFAPD